VNPDLGHSDESAGASFHVIDRRRRGLANLAGVLLSAMCLTLVLISGRPGVGLALASRWPTIVGLVGLVAIFLLYLQLKQRELMDLERQLRDAAVREAATMARFEELSSLFDAGTQLQLRLDLASMLDLAVQRLHSSLDATRSSIILRDEATGALQIRAAAGAEASYLVGMTLQPGEGIAGHVFESGETLILTPEVMAERFPDDAGPDAAHASALCVPMRVRGTTIGVVSVIRVSGEPFEKIHARMLETFAEHCAATVVKTEHHHELLDRMRPAA
jgi:transcriptional regulator with GAF, ATPase, and Fis domain